MKLKASFTAEASAEGLLGFGAGLRSLQAKVGEKPVPPKKDFEEPPEDFFEEEEDLSPA